jgi:hypothetical protein
MATEQHPDPDFVPVAEVEIDSVEPSPRGFVLHGSGADSAEYRMDMQMDIRVDPKTRAVLSEIFSQSAWRIWRRLPLTLRARRSDRSPTSAR